MVVRVNRTAPRCTAGGAVIVAVLTGLLTPQAHGGDDRERRSAEVMRDLVPSSDGPGCAAAVGKRGEVVWEAGRGKADLETGRAITPETVFDMASNSKQFTADAVLLLAGRHRLALADPLSGHLDDPPAWTRDVTLGDLVHHTSGIPDYQDLLEAEGVEVTDPAGQEEALAAILASRPEQTPGKAFSYSNSNYVLLAHVVERVTGKPFPAFLQQEFFTPLHLRMTLAPAAEVPGKAKSYDGKDGSYTPNSSPWKQYGDGSVQTTPGELVRWADNYRTGRVGGKALLAGVTDGAVGVGDVLRPRGIEEGRYGAGMLVLPDNSLVHRGDWEQFHSTFKVSPDRDTAVTVVCNADPPDSFRAANRLLDIWTK
ncbi:serine hydrolase domain-containing protein [Streptomyces lavendulae]|uniref:serine hydrolase domain-containing protein n=1 Tax=Streptomyces lavendulae TaxID=1914 RepID=UPI0024A0932A|nr:serine hydrolase domain-containing protein [Streptomyces lavendulae]GLX24033.1 lipoprotein [Streptomyces lavendulae subsp. lavendulae]GLX31894.1 lipoprotein [Streptomyces lavendulae subsp. lavendulae]